MSETTPPAGTRGAVDLSSVAGTDDPRPRRPPGGGMPAGAVPGRAGPPLQPAVPGGLVVEVDAGQPPGGAEPHPPGARRARAVGVGLPADPRARRHRRAGRRARSRAGCSCSAPTCRRSPELLQAFQPLLVQAFGQPSVPATFGLLQGQPVPLFPGVAARERGAGGARPAAPGRRAERHHRPGRARGRRRAPTTPTSCRRCTRRPSTPSSAATSTARPRRYEQALAENPKDHDAELGLAQVRLMQRTEGVDLAAARAAAAADPTDVEAAIVVADLDVLGGHVEDAFTRLLDLVRVVVRRRARPGPHPPARAVRGRRQPRRARAQGPHGPDERPVLTRCRPSSSTTTSGSGSTSADPGVTAVVLQCDRAVAGPREFRRDARRLGARRAAPRAAAHRVPLRRRAGRRRRGGARPGQPGDRAHGVRRPVGAWRCPGTRRPGGCRRRPSPGRLEPHTLAGETATRCP